MVHKLCMCVATGELATTLEASGSLELIPTTPDRSGDHKKQKGKCFFCGKLGHYEAECRTKAAQGRTAAHAALGSQAVVLTAASGDQINSYTWTVDSGA